MPNIQLNTIKFVFCWIYWVSLFFKDHQARCFQHTSPVLKVFCSINFRASRYFMCSRKSCVMFHLYGCEMVTSRIWQTTTILFSRMFCSFVVVLEGTMIQLSTICNMRLLFRACKEWLVCALKKIRRRRRKCHYSNKVWCFYGLLKHKMAFRSQHKQQRKIFFRENILVSEHMFVECKKTHLLEFYALNYLHINLTWKNVLTRAGICISLDFEKITCINDSTTHSDKLRHFILRPGGRSRKWKLLS